MVGDRMDTDVISGLESGMSTVLVLSGVSTCETANAFAYRPTMILDDVGDIVRLAQNNSTAQDPAGKKAVKATATDGIKD